MSRLRPRLRAFVALVALCLSVGPAASALCPHDGEPQSAPQEMDAAMGPGAMDEMSPCHDAPPAPESPAPSDAADCASPCCVVSTAPAPVTADAPTVSASVALVAWEFASLPAEPVFGDAAVPPRVPPRPVLERSVRLRV